MPTEASKNSRDAPSADEPIESDAITRGVKTLMGMFDTPSFLRRAGRVNDAIDAVRRKCQAQREEWLHGVRLRLRAWRAVVGKHPDLAIRLPPDASRAIAAIAEVTGDSAASPLPLAVGKPSTVWKDLVESVERFNARWTRFVNSVDAQAANALIDGYNRNYLFEKECALRSARAAMRGYRPIERITIEWLLREFPALPTLLPWRG